MKADQTTRKATAQSRGKKRLRRRQILSVSRESRFARQAGWDYLIVTAANDNQAMFYRDQLALRRRLGLLHDVGEFLVLADPGGRRIGSGGSTLCCLIEILRRETVADASHDADPAAWTNALRHRRVLILHAGGDSRRLPAYGPLGKLFVPVPSSDAICCTLFDHLIELYSAIPAASRESGQVLIASGDVLLDFDPLELRFAQEGITGLGVLAPAELSAHHGVFLVGPGGRVERFLQKPPVEQQLGEGLVDDSGKSVLDVGIMSMDAEAAATILGAFGIKDLADADGAGRSSPWSVRTGQELDLYREIACALGSGTRLDEYIAAAQSAGSSWSKDHLGDFFESLHDVPFHVHVVPQVGFLHFGTTSELITSGQEIIRSTKGVRSASRCVQVNSLAASDPCIPNVDAWVEGCLVQSPLQLGGGNVVTGLDVAEPLALPAGACVDVSAGRDRDGEQVFFIRCYGVDDSFKRGGETYCGHRLDEWLRAVGASAEDVWDPTIATEERSAWNAQLIPAEAVPAGYRRWLWVFDPSSAADSEKRDWRRAERFSYAEMAMHLDHAQFSARRLSFRANELASNLPRLLASDGQMSATELACLIAHCQEPARCVAGLLEELRADVEGRQSNGATRPLRFARMMHTLGSALATIADAPNCPMTRLLPGLERALSKVLAKWLSGLGFPPLDRATVKDWSGQANRLAVHHLARTIVASAPEPDGTRRRSLRKDEIVWGRAPARLDLAGGWTDTPPYSLEFGGAVLNAAVDLNGQPPIQVFARVIEEPVIRIASIDQGARSEVRQLDDLLDYSRVGSDFALAKAAIALCTFPALAVGCNDATNERSMRQLFECFGGGLELTTLAAIPKGSGLGTSSIMGAVLLSVLARVSATPLEPTELFHRVLRLEQMLTTGGGWQDQVGGAVDGVKLITTEPGLIPTPEIRFTPGDVLDPLSNGGQTLLYYTGITRLAKDVLAQVVGRYLDRDRGTLATLRRIHALAPLTAATMARRDIADFGHCVNEAWQLNKQLIAASSNEEVERLLAVAEPYVYGAKLLGAGGGGFVLWIANSPSDARRLHALLTTNPPNPRARFFSFTLNRQGLRVTAC